MAIDVDIGENKLKLVCIYAPNVAAEKKIFFSKLPEFSERGRTIILAGDFNTITSDLDKNNL